MAITFCFDPHPAWEHDFHTLRHLPHEKLIFFTFSTPPQREAQNQQNPPIWPSFRRIGLKHEKRKTQANRNPARATTIGTRFSDSEKMKNPCKNPSYFQGNIKKSNKSAHTHFVQKTCNLSIIVCFSNEFPQFSILNELMQIHVLPFMIPRPQIWPDEPKLPHF